MIELSCAKASERALRLRTFGEGHGQVLVYIGPPPRSLLGVWRFETLGTNAKRQTPDNPLASLKGGEGQGEEALSFFSSTLDDGR